MSLLLVVGQDLGGSQEDAAVGRSTEVAPISKASIGVATQEILIEQIKIKVLCFI